MSGTEPLGVFAHGDITGIMQHLNVPVAAGRGRDDRRRAAALEAAAGDAERGDGRAELPVMGAADGPFDQERLGGAGEQPLGGGQHLQRAGLVPAVPAVLCDAVPGLAASNERDLPLGHNATRAS
jgi:hypothetical protein